MTPEEQAIKAAAKQAAIRNVTTQAAKPQARYRISVAATFLDAAGNDPEKLRESAVAYLQQCGMAIVACDIEEEKQ